MEKELFDDLILSLQEARAIAKAEMPASRRFSVEAPNVKALREKVGLSQSEFAKLLHVSIKTLQNWEQHRRNPAGPALALLKLVGALPENSLKILYSA